MHWLRDWPVLPESSHAVYSVQQFVEREEVVLAKSFPGLSHSKSPHHLPFYRQMTDSFTHTRNSARSSTARSIDAVSKHTVVGISLG